METSFQGMNKDEKTLRRPVVCRPEKLKGGINMRFLDVSKKIMLCSMMAFLVSLGVPPSGSAADIEIKIGACFDITGPYADPGFLRAYQGLIKLTNESGGFKDVKGQTCKLKLIWKDGQSKVPEALMAYKEFKAAGCVVHSYSSTSQYMSLRAQARADKIPMSSQAVTNLTFEGEAGSWLYGQMGNREAVICGLDGLKKIWKKALYQRI